MRTRIPVVFAATAGSRSNTGRSEMLLAQTIVQILANALAFAFADFQDFLLHPFAFGNVAKDDQPVCRPARSVLDGQDPPLAPTLALGGLDRLRL